MLRLFFATLFLLCFYHGLTQDFCAQVTYECRTKLAVGPVYDGRNTLYFNNEKGLFVHNDYPKSDQYDDAGFSVNYTKGDDEGLPVFIHLKDNYLYYKSAYSAPPGELFIFKDTLPEINWTVGTATKKIGDFNCLSASGEFGGRTYDVWFTPEIPVRLGPYKLCGLPGMILEAASRDGKVAYHFIAYQSPCERKIEPPKRGKEITWREFEKFVINKLIKTEALSTPGVTITNDDPPADYEIERNKFTIISNYKNQRSNK